MKEYYFYLDATPTSSYLAYRYRYPLRAYPYADLVATNRSRGRNEMEYELIDTGVFDDDRYVDLDIEYAKAGPEDVHIRLTVRNRSAEPATVQLLPTLWFRNTWWFGGAKGQLRAVGGPAGAGRPGAPSRSPSTIRPWGSGRCGARDSRCCSSPRTRRTRNACGASPTRRRS